MLLAKSFVLLREECLTLQSGTAHSTNKAGVMPSVTQCLQEFVSSLDGELTAMAASPKQIVKVLLTVRFSILQVEGVVSDWLLTGSTQKAINMPRLFESIYDLPKYLGLAAAACRSEKVFIAVFAVNRSLFFHETDICEGRAAVRTVKFLLMPRFPHCNQKWPSDDHVAVCTHGCASPSRDMFCHLNQSVLIFRVWLRHRSGWDRTSWDAGAAITLHPERWSDQTCVWTEALDSSRSFDHGLNNCRLMGVEFRLLTLLTAQMDRGKTQITSLVMFCNQT